MKCLPVYAAMGVAFASLIGASIPGLAQGESVPEASVLQAMADAVLIDSHCRDMPVDFGAVTRYGERHGVAASAIMPLGALRKDFEADLSARLGAVSPEALCTSIAAATRDRVPGAIRRP